MKILILLSLFLSITLCFNTYLPNRSGSLGSNIRALEASDKNNCGVSGWRCKIYVPVKKFGYNRYQESNYVRRRTWFPRLRSRFRSGFVY